jgi:photosystem II stability/assembly factor-like uncharacterized protein
MVRILSAAAFACISLFMFSCRKKDGMTQDQPPPQPVDTLAAGWSKVILPDGLHVTDIYFIGATGFALGNSLFKSTDGGLTWQKQTAFSLSGTASDIAMGSAQNLAIGGNSNSIVTSVNGGAGFTNYNISGAQTSTSGLFYKSPNDVIATGRRTFLSSDAGLTWQEAGSIPSSATSYNNVFFLNNSLGWNISDAGLYKTTNGGTTWNKDLPFTFTVEGGLGVVQFTDANTGYVSSKTALYKTTNGGGTWSALPSVNSIIAANPAIFFPDIHFLSNTLGYFLAGKSLYKTTDGGASWTRVVKMASIDLAEIHFTDANHGWACGDQGTILRFEQ